MSTVYVEFSYVVEVEVDNLSADRGKIIEMAFDSFTSDLDGITAGDFEANIMESI